MSKKGCSKSCGNCSRLKPRLCWSRCHRRRQATDCPTSRVSLAADVWSARVRLRRAQTGALVFEFPGADGAKTADNFAEKLRGIFAATEGVRIARPTICAELRISILDNSVTVDNVCVAIGEKTKGSAGSAPSASVQEGSARQDPHRLRESQDNSSGDDTDEVLQLPCRGTHSHKVRKLL